MTWTKIEPAAARKASKVTLRLSLRKSGSGRLWISFPTTVGALCGFEKAEHVNCYLGEGENAGQMMIEPSKDGGNKLTHLAHAMIAKIEVPPGVPLKENVATLDYERRRDGGLGFIIKLPAWALPGGDPAAESADVDVANERPGALEMRGTMMIFGTKEVALTKCEAAIAKILIENFGKTVLKNMVRLELLATDPEAGSVDVWLSKLRTKIMAKAVPLTIVTHQGVGYELRRAVAK